MRILLTALISVCLVSCSTLPVSFTTENIMKIHQGMTSQEILELFGEPRSISTAVCQPENGKPWNCTTWKYGEFPYDYASFTFSGERGYYILNHFNIERESLSEKF